MKQPIAIALSALAAATPFAYRDHYARQRIPRMQRELDVLHGQELRDRQMIWNLADCTSVVYPITTGPGNALYLSPNAKYDRIYMPAGRPGGCTP